MTTEERRDLEHATNLKIARELIDITWRDAEGCAVPEQSLREVAQRLNTIEGRLRERLAIRRARKDGKDGNENG